MAREHAFRTKIFSIQGNLTAPQVLERLKRITAGEFHDAAKSPEYKYYGSVTGTVFHLCNKKYGPHSSGPWIKGEINNLDGKVVITVAGDVQEQTELVKRFLFPFFIAFGLLVGAVGMTMPEYRQIYLWAGAVLLACPFAYVTIARHLLSSMLRDEVRQFEKVVRGWQVTFKQPRRQEMALAKS